MSEATRLRRQLMVVAAILLGLVLGAAALVRFGPEIQAVEVGAKAPDFRVYDLAGGDTVSLRQRYRNTVTLVNIWATWCQPCRVEMPAMQRLYDSLSPKGFKIAAVSIDEGNPENVRKFVKELGLSFDILQDRSTRIQGAYQTTGVPESFLLNRDGIIIKRVIGAQDWSSEVNRALVERLLAEPGSATP
jgi:cytochrome c biogenesis protein CcmG/thiol:disulfide interchange protein DsbE